LNGKTFDGYMATFRGEDDLAYKSFIDGGAIPESQVMLLKSIPLGGGIIRLLSAYCEAVMLESRIYLAHVNNGAKNTVIGDSWKWQWLPQRVFEQYTFNSESWNRCVQPYIIQMNRYFELRAFLEKIKSNVEQAEDCLAALEVCKSDAFEVVVYSSGAFSGSIGKQRIEKNLIDIFTKEELWETIICSPNVTIINDFICLLEGYERASEEGDLNIYLDSIFKVIDAPGLERVFAESSEEGYELDDSFQKIDARHVLFLYLEGLEIFSPAMVDHILQQLEDGKREDGIFSGADEEVREAYDLFCSSALEEE